MQVGLLASAEIFQPVAAELQRIGYKIHAVWCKNVDLSVEVASHQDIPFVASQPDEILLRKDVHVVLIVGCPHMHAQIAVKTLGIGKHVICGNPFSLARSDSVKMVQAAQYYPQLLSAVGYSLRSLEVFQKMNSLLREGFIGDIHMVDVNFECGSLVLDSFNWMCDQDMGGGILSLVGSHIIDLMFYLLDNVLLMKDHTIGWVQGYLDTFRTHTDTINGIRRITADDVCNFNMHLSQKPRALVNASDTERKESIFAAVSLKSHSILSKVDLGVMLSGSKGILRVRNGKLFGCNTELGVRANESLLYDNTCDENDESNPSMISPLFWSGFIASLAEAKHQLDLLISSQEDGPKHRSMSSPTELQSCGSPTLARSRDAVLKGCSNTLANFEDAQRVFCVVDAVVQSNKSREWVRIELPSSDAVLL